MTREEYIDFANALKNNYTIDFDKIPEFCDMAISALSEELSADGTLTVHVSDGSKVTRVFVMGDNIFGGLYYPDSADDNTMEWHKYYRQNGDDDYCCSKCKFIIRRPNILRCKYCPNCGRKAVNK